MFNFDIIVTISYEILIILPNLFKLYKIVFHPQLRAFYNRVRFAIIKFLMLISFMACLISVLHFWISQQPPCISWTRDGISPDQTSSQSPHFELSITFFICSVIWRTNFGYSLYRKIISVLLFLIHFIGLILDGSLSISTAISSTALGFWALIFFDLLPQIGFPSFGLLICVIDLIICSILVSKQIKRSIFLKDIQCCYSGIITSITSLYLYFRFAILHKSFKWVDSPYRIQRFLETGEDAYAVIPLSSSNRQEDPLMELLSKDLLDGILCFLFYLLGNFFLKIYLDYDIYQ